VAHIRTVNNQTSPHKEIEMDNAIASAVRAITICIATILVYNTADASAGSYTHNESMTDAPLTHVVHFADLDLSRIEGVTALYGRLRQAARIVCRPLESTTLVVDEKHRACMDNAMADAVTSVNRPLLSRYHQLRTKGDTAGIVQIAKGN
jgi:UrcA family protein